MAGASSRTLDSKEGLDLIAVKNDKFPEAICSKLAITYNLGCPWLHDSGMGRVARSCDSNIYNSLWKSTLSDYC